MVLTRFDTYSPDDLFYGEEENKGSLHALIQESYLDIKSKVYNVAYCLSSGLADQLNLASMGTQHEFFQNILPERILYFIKMLFYIL